MGKPGKKAGNGLLPPTNINRRADKSKTSLRDQRTIKRLKMYSSKIVRDEKGNIVKGSVLKASDRIDQQMARIAPDRRWFGNTRVIGQEALQKFRTEMGAKYKDPYSVIIKQGKLPLSLLEEPKQKDTIRSEMEWDKTFGEKATRKRVNLKAVDLSEFVQQASEKTGEYSSGKVAKDRSLVKPLAESRDDRSKNRGLFKKGQSSRIWNELYKVIDSADVILYVLDARDPMGTRSPFLEDYLRREKKHKHFVFVLNKCDLIPLWATARWLQILSKDYPTIAFHASVNHPFGKGNVISLLRQFARLHNVTHRGNKRTKTPISVGIVGYPNVGKSSVINTLRRKSVCKVAPIPGETKVWQYVALTKTIFLIDCPGVVYDRESNNDVQAVLKGVVRVERLGSADKTDVVHTVLEIVKKKDIVATYGVAEWRDVNDFLEQLAKNRGKLVAGGQPDIEAATRSVLYDWQRGKIPWFNAPPFDSNQQYRDALLEAEDMHMKKIEHYSAFNVVDDRMEYAGGDAVDGSDDNSADDEDNEGAAEEDTSEALVEPGTQGSRKRKQNEITADDADQKKDTRAGKQKGKKAPVDPDMNVVGYMNMQEEQERKRKRQELREKKREIARNAAAVNHFSTADGVGSSSEPTSTSDDTLWDQFLAAAQK